MEMFIIIKCHTYGKDARKNIASSHHPTAKHLRIRFFGAKDPKYIVPHYILNYASFATHKQN